MRTALVTLAAIAACNGSGGRGHVEFAHLAFDVPGDWTNHDEVRRGISTTVWTPEDNGRKESIIVIRTHMAGAVPQAGTGTLDRLLASAVEHLPGARISARQPLTTEKGMQGIRVALSYMPPSTHERYSRVHVVLVDAAKASLVHVIYTAKVPDENLEALDMVLSTLREEG